MPFEGLEEGGVLGGGCFRGLFIGYNGGLFSWGSEVGMMLFGWS